jgi:hypothetical protein
MEKLDKLVSDNLVERLFKPERLALLLSSLAARRAEKAESLNTRLIALHKEVSDADEKLARLYRLVEDGVTDLDDVLKDRLATLKAVRERANAALQRAKETSAQAIRIDPGTIERFGRVVSECFQNGSVAFRKAYLQSIVDRIEVDDTKVRIEGSKELLEAAVLASQRGSDASSHLSTSWRAGRNKTANTYVIEIPL